MSRVPAPAVAIGEWCELTRGFYSGGRYVTAEELRPGDVYRWTTYTGHTVVAADVCHHSPDGPMVHVDNGATIPAIFRPGDVLELTARDGYTWPAVDRDGWPLGVHGPGMSAAPCARECGHPLGEHGPYGCEHFAAGHDNGLRSCLHGCSCPVTWHGGIQ
jgi:hypothetical protein